MNKMAQMRFRPAATQCAVFSNEDSSSYNENLQLFLTLTGGGGNDMPSYLHVLHPNSKNMAQTDGDTLAGE
jgi:hypothetical protein